MKRFYTNLDIFNFLEKQASADDEIDVIDPRGLTYDRDNTIGSRHSWGNWLSDLFGAWFTTDTDNSLMNSSEERLRKLLREHSVINNKSTGELSALDQDLKRHLLQFHRAYRDIISEGDQDKDTSKHMPLYKALNNIRLLAQKASNKDELNSIKKLYDQTVNFLKDEVGDSQFLETVLDTPFKTKSGLETSGNTLLSTVAQKQKELAAKKPTLATAKDQILTKFYKGEISAEDMRSQLNNLAYGDMQQRLDNLERRRNMLPEDVYQQKLMELYNDVQDGSSKYDDYGPTAAQAEQLLGYIEQKGFDHDITSIKDRALSRRFGDIATNHRYKTDKNFRDRQYAQYSRLTGKSRDDYYNEIYKNVDPKERFNKLKYYALDESPKGGGNFAMGYDASTNELLYGNGSKPSTRVKMNPAFWSAMKRGVNLNNVESLRDQLIDAGVDEESAYRILLGKGRRYTDAYTDKNKPGERFRIMYHSDGNNGPKINNRFVQDIKNLYGENNKAQQPVQQGTQPIIQPKRPRI